MSEIDKIINPTKWGSFSGDAMKVQRIIEGYENMWQNTNLWDVYKRRVLSVKELFVRPGDSKKDTITKPKEQKIFIYSPKKIKGKILNDISPIASKCDDTDYNMPEPGKVDGLHDIAAAILMEMGNCLINPNAIPNIRRKFYNGDISLTQVGIEIAGEEGAGMWDYIKMMRVIPADQRPYQSNRDIYKTRHVQTDPQFAKYFADTKHAGPTSLLSGETYAYESLSLASRDDVKKLLYAIGGKLLGVLTSGRDWPNVVQLLSNKFGADTAYNTSFYGATLELIKGYQSLHNMFSPWHDPWELTKGMETKFVPKSVMVNKSEYRSMCESITKGIPGVPKQMSPTKDISNITRTNKYLKVN